MLTPDVAATFLTREQLVNSRNDMASRNLWCLRLNARNLGGTAGATRLKLRKIKYFLTLTISYHLIRLH
jgi:hypothetical protein